MNSYRPYESNSTPHKVHIILNISPNPLSSAGTTSWELEDTFDKVGKGLHLGWKVNTDIRGV